MLCVGIQTKQQGITTEDRGDEFKPKYLIVFGLFASIATWPFDKVK